MILSAPETLVHALRRASEQRAFGMRFLNRREQEESFRYDQLEEYATCVALQLLERGLTPGERVGIVLPTCPAFLYTFFGVLLADAIPVPLYPPVRLGRIDEYIPRTVAMLSAVDAVMIVYDKRGQRFLGEVVQQAHLSLGAHQVDDLLRPCDSSLSLTATSPDDVALIQFSSGTTQQPKPVTLTHRQILANVEAMVQAFPSDVETHIGVCWLPLYHDMGLIGCVMTALCLAAPLTLIPPEVFLAKPSIWLRAISRYRATISPAPNFAYSLCVDKIHDDEMDNVDLSSWRLALNGAEPINASALHSFQQRFTSYQLRPEAITPVYGLSEATLAVSFYDANTSFRSTTFSRETLTTLGQATPGDDFTLVSVGKPLQGVCIEVRDAQTGDMCEPGLVGAIWIKSPALMKGYWGQQDLKRESCLDTGDLGFWYKGELYISGRAKDMIVIRGRNHLPHDIEQSCDSVEGIRTGCVVAVSHIDEQGEHLVVFAEYRNAHDNLAEDCRQAILAHTGVEPSFVILIKPSTLPRTSSGKLRRKETLRQWLNGELRPAQHVSLMLASTWLKSQWSHLLTKIKHNES